jgi:hypothetical protein
VKNRPRVLSRRSTRVVLGAGLVTAAALGTLVQTAEAGGPPGVTLSATGHLSDGQTISVSVGPNSYFTPHAGVNILECADPGGSAANLPTSISTCDGNTIQGTTVLVANDGSFSESSYQVYALPSSTLGEQANDQPVCNQTNYCVLYVGQNQNDFTAPKTFSAPFLITATTGTTTATTPPAAGGTSSSGSGTTPGNSSGLSPSASSTATKAATAATTGPTDPSTTGVGASSLADTGPSPELLWLAGSGFALLLTGAVGRRRVLREVR